VTLVAFSVDVVDTLVELGAGTGFLVVWWAVAVVLPFALADPAWSGSVVGRRALGVGCLAGLCCALQWLSAEPGDAAGYVVGGVVAVLFATATAAALLAERQAP
jgi:hypothetical protein